MDDNEAFYFKEPQAGFVRISGQDRLTYLQRQTTNDTRLLSPERALLTVLTSPTARIVDVFFVLQLADAVGLVTLPGRGKAVTRYFKSRIFFNDHVEVDDDSDEYIQYELDGDLSETAWNLLGFSAPSEAFEVKTGKVAGAEVRLLAQGNSIGFPYRFIIHKMAAADFEERLDAVGAMPVSSEEYDIRRVEAGRPGIHHELTEDFTPLEVNLSQAVAANKGCYTGQEVIARQLTYGKVTRKLMGLRLQADVPTGSQLASNGKRVGVVTSTAHSPRFGPIALAVLRRPNDQPGMELVIENGGEQIKAEVTSLPFG